MQMKRSKLFYNTHQGVKRSLNLEQALSPWVRRPVSPGPRTHHCREGGEAWAAGAGTAGRGPRLYTVHTQRRSLRDCQSLVREGHTGRIQAQSSSWLQSVFYFQQTPASHYGEIDLTALPDAIALLDFGDALILLSERGVRVHFYMSYRSTTSCLKFVRPDTFGTENLRIWK